MSKGGDFLWEKPNCQDVFIPEEFTDEQHMIAEMAEDFVNNEVAPLIAEIEEQKPGLMQELLRKAGQLGLLSADVPEQYGGAGLDLISSLLITENFPPGGSFVVAHTDHTGIGTLPIVFFGNDEQKNRYLPMLATGEKLGAYALTESGSGSDALAAKTSAVLSSDGKHYVINGSKQFITNAGIADLFITYAKINGEKFTAFIVDKDSEGLFLGPEEKKMGIKGSSTRSVTFEDVKVPIENLLFEIGKGHLVAFNILNIGRFKLAAQCVGTAKWAIKLAVKYAQEREQFGQPIAKFGLIQEKLANMVTDTYIAESMMYRSGGRINDILGEAESSGEGIAKCIEEYVVECSINKVFASEVLDRIANHAVQIFGGYGYSQEYLVEQIYRDSRINLIFEGTNEINRLIICDTILRRSTKGQLPPIPEIIISELENLSNAYTHQQERESLLAQEQAVDFSKKVFFLVAGKATQKYKDKLGLQQEIVGILADLVIEIYAMESGLLRAKKVVEKESSSRAALQIDIVKSYFNYAVPHIQGLGREALAALIEADELCAELALFEKMTRYTPVDGIACRRRITDRVLDLAGYVV